MEQPTTCPVWDTAAMDLPTTRDGRHVISSRTDGAYFLSASAEPAVRNLDDLDRTRLTAWLVEQRRLGQAVPEIYSSTLTEVAARRLPTVHERADALLQCIAASSDTLGHVLVFYDPHNPKKTSAADKIFAWTSSRASSEVAILAEYCASEGWIEDRKVQRTTTPTTWIHQLCLRPPGYAHLATLNASGSSSSQAFVAMWFDPSMQSIFDNGFAPAIRDAGFEPLRIDGKQHNNKIDDEIIAELRRSRFVVADFTQGVDGARGGVYYEAGFAHGAGLPVIFTCSAAAIQHAHFDTRQYNHIVWDNEADLRKKLAARISATIGDGPLKKRP